MNACMEQRSERHWVREVIYFPSETKEEKKVKWFYAIKLLPWLILLLDAKIGDNDEFDGHVRRKNYTGNKIAFKKKKDVIICNNYDQVEGSLVFKFVNWRN